MDDKRFGFEEIEHTADWALRVWAADLPQLFALAAEGMYGLMEVILEPGERLEQTLELEGLDAESLLVAFLSELLYVGESQALGFDRFEIAFHEDISQSVMRLLVHAVGAPITRQKKEIKAVTFHNLRIEERDGLVWVTIVFDV